MASLTLSRLSASTNRPIACKCGKALRSWCRDAYIGAVFTCACEPDSPVNWYRSYNTKRGNCDRAVRQVGWFDSRTGRRDHYW